MAFPALSYNSAAFIFLLGLGMSKKNSIVVSSQLPEQPWWEQGAGRWLLSSLPTGPQSTAVSPRSHPADGDCQPLGWALQPRLCWRPQSCVQGAATWLSVAEASQGRAAGRHLSRLLPGKVGSLQLLCFARRVCMPRKWLFGKVAEYLIVLYRSPCEA